MGFPGVSDGKESACNAGDPGLIPGSGRFPRKGNTNNSSILAWETSWTEEPACYSPWVAKEWDSTERLRLSLSDINKSPHPDGAATAVVLEVEALFNLWRVLRLFRRERQQEEKPEETSEYTTRQSLLASAGWEHPRKPGCL